MARGLLVSAVISLALVSTSSAVLPAAATTHEAVRAHKLIVIVKRPRPGSWEETRRPGSHQPEGRRPRSSLGHVEQARRRSSGQQRPLPSKGLIDAACKGGCATAYRISGSANHKLEVTPSCLFKGSSFVCSKVKIVTVYW